MGFRRSSAAAAAMALFVMAGCASAPAIGVTGGVHGNEPSGVAALARLKDEYEFDPKPMGGRGTAATAY